MVSAISFFVAYVIVDALCLALTVIVSANVSRDSGSETQVRFFRLLLMANVIFDIFDATWAFLVFSQVVEASELVLGVVNGINLTAVAFSAYFWFCFSLAYFESQVTDSRSMRAIAAIPAISVLAFHTFGYGTGQNVIFLEDGGVAYGTMHIINTLVPLLYLLAATVVALHRYRHATSRATRRMSLVFILFMAAPAASGVFDILVPDMPVAAAGIMISIVFVNMAMQEARISNDALTGLNNRRRAESFLEDSLARASSEHPVHFFLVDMDQFKSINDGYGHLEGDHALRLMADTLRVVGARQNAFAARWGGDEFVLIDARNDECDTDEVAALIQGQLADVARQAKVPYALACSVGYARGEGPADRDRLLSDADKMLYRKKRGFAA